MILILSSENDQTTNQIISWLKIQKKNYFRFSEESEVILEKLIINDNQINFQLTIDNGFEKKKIRYNEIKSFWYRRSNLVLSNNNFSDNFEIDSKFRSNISSMLREEKKFVEDFIYMLLNEKNSINKRSDNEINKLQFLWAASKFGISIPSTFISSQLSNLKSFMSKQEVITKPIVGGFSHGIEESPYSTLAMTELLTLNDLKSLPEEIAVSKLQEKVNKMFEIRTFYIRGKFFSSAIFSQNNIQTSVDFRNYDSDKPNRILPFSLPLDLESRLDKLMQYFNINSGSFDIIYTQDEEYVILEVNPIGQFLQVSEPCNYKLPKYISKILSYENTI